MHTQNQEDYLRAMYELFEKQINIKSGIKKTEVANFLEISKPGVTQMMNKFLKEGLVEIDLYSRIFFTKKGFIFAKKITRKHRIIEVFLRDILGCKSLKKINDEAHKLEHGFSESTIKRLEKYLGNPKKCPHGYKINN